MTSHARMAAALVVLAGGPDICPTSLRITLTSVR